MAIETRYKAISRIEMSHQGGVDTETQCQPFDRFQHLSFRYVRKGGIVRIYKMQNQD